MSRILGTILLSLSLTGLALANGVAAPEIDPSSSTMALTALAGALLIIRSGGKK